MVLLRLQDGIQVGSPGLPSYFGSDFRGLMYGCKLKVHIVEHMLMYMFIS